MILQSPGPPASLLSASASGPNAVPWTVKKVRSSRPIIPRIVFRYGVRKSGWRGILAEEAPARRDRDIDRAVAHGGPLACRRDVEGPAHADDMVDPRLQRRRHGITCASACRSPAHPHAPVPRSVPRTAPWCRPRPARPPAIAGTSHTSPSTCGMSRPPSTRLINVAGRILPATGNRGSCWNAGGSGLQPREGWR